MKSNLLITFGSLAAMFAGTVVAGPLGTAFTYQGQLQDGGSPAQGTYAFRFALYDAARGRRPSRQCHNQ